MTRVSIGFGSNVGERERFVREALRLLERVVAVDAVSSLYETAPMYVEDQPSFLNGVVIGATDLGPVALVEALKRIEKEVGRTPSQAKGPREIDLDLLLYGRLVLRFRGSRDVRVPHPLMHERRFVLEPLNEVAPEAFVPLVGPVEALLGQDSVQSQQVRRVAHAAVPLSRPQ